LYYGEIGMNGNKDKGDADIRHDFPVAGCWWEQLIQGRSQGQNEYFDFTAKLFQWRKIAKLCILEDDPLHSWNNVYIYFRHNDQSTVMVILNNSNEVKVSTSVCRKHSKNTAGKIFNKSANWH
jgi:hypothetical protein